MLNDHQISQAIRDLDPKPAPVDGWERMAHDIARAMDNEDVIEFDAEAAEAMIERHRKAESAMRARLRTVAGEAQALRAEVAQGKNEIRRLRLLVLFQWWAMGGLVVGLAVMMGMLVGRS